MSFFFNIENFSFLITPKIFASKFGNFFVIWLRGMLINLQLSLTNISRSLILFWANVTLSRAPGASNFLCIDLAISISGDIITSIGRFSLL